MKILMLLFIAFSNNLFSFVRKNKSHNLQIKNYSIYSIKLLKKFDLNEFEHVSIDTRLFSTRKNIYIYNVVNSKFHLKIHHILRH